VTTAGQRSARIEVERCFVCIFPKTQTVFRNTAFYLPDKSHIFTGDNLLEPRFRVKPVLECLVFDQKCTILC